MSDKAKKVMKFVLTVGIVLFAVAAVFAIVVKMQKKLAAVGEEKAVDGGCTGSCSECGMCDSDEEAEEELSEENTDEAVSEGEQEN